MRTRVRIGHKSQQGGFALKKQAYLPLHHTIRGTRQSYCSGSGFLRVVCTPVLWKLLTAAAHFGAPRPCSVDGETNPSPTRSEFDSRCGLRSCSVMGLAYGVYDVTEADGVKREVVHISLECRYLRRTTGAPER